MNESQSTFFGTKAKRENVVAFCDLHKKGLTIRQMKTKGCLGKQCFHLIKYENSYWHTREKLAKRKKEHREILKNGN